MEEIARSHLLRKWLVAAYRYNGLSASCRMGHYRLREIWASEQTKYGVELPTSRPRLRAMHRESGHAFERSLHGRWLVRVRGAECVALSVYVGLC